MTVVIRAYMLALASLGDPRIRRLIWISVAVTALILGGMLWLGDQALAPLEGSLDRLPGWLVVAVKAAGATVLFWLVTPGILMAVESQLSDDIAEAVERRDYPHDRPGRALGWVPSLGIGLKLLSLTILVNLIALPLHIAVFWFPLLNLVLVYGVNGYCLSRALVDQIGLRYVRGRELRDLRRAGGWSCFLCGVVAAVVLSIPLLNLVGPILATVASVHVVKAALRARGSWKSDEEEFG